MNTGFYSEIGYLVFCSVLVLARLWLWLWFRFWFSISEENRGWSTGGIFLGSDSHFAKGLLRLMVFGACLWRIAIVG